MLIPALVQSIIDEKTLLPLGTALAVLIPIGVGFNWLSKKLSKLDQRLASIERASFETWSYTQMRVWTLQLERANRNDNIKLVVPEPDRPIRTTMRDEEPSF